MNPLLKLLLLLSPLLSPSQVGINTTLPTKTLDINGDLRVRNILNNGTVNDYILLVDEEGNVKKAKLSELTNSCGCPELIKQQSTPYYLIFKSTCSIPNPNNPVTIEGKSFVSAGTWTENNLYYFSYSNTTGVGIDTSNINITFTNLNCKYN